MATIRARRQANGTLRYTAMVRLRKGKTLIHQEAKTFSYRGAAASWAKFREVELQKPGALDQAQQGETSLAALIRWYIDSFFEIAVWQRTKQTSLEFLEKHQIGEVNALRIASAMLVNHVPSARRSLSQGAAARLSCVSSELAHKRIDVLAAVGAP